VNLGLAIRGNCEDRRSEYWRVERINGRNEYLRIEERNNLCLSRNIMRVTKSERMMWIDHVARITGMRRAYRVLIGGHEGTVHIIDLHMDEV
jgi:hypothetical protein